MDRHRQQLFMNMYLVHVYMDGYVCGTCMDMSVTCILMTFCFYVDGIAAIGEECP